MTCIYVIESLAWATGGLAIGYAVRIALALLERHREDAP